MHARPGSVQQYCRIIAGGPGQIVQGHEVDPGEGDGHQLQERACRCVAPGRPDTRACALPGRRALFLWVPEIPIWLSLLFIAATIVVATVASLLKTRGDENKDDRGLIYDEPVITADPRNEESEVDKKARLTAKSK